MTPCQPRPPARRPARPRPAEHRRSPSRPAQQHRQYRRPVRRVAQLRLADGYRRLRMAVLLLAVVLSLFAGRLVQLQGLDATTYASAAEAGRLRTVALPAYRGTITDRNGVALATTVVAVDITADQTLVTDPAGEARALAPVLRVDAAVLEARLRGQKRFVSVARNVTPATWRKVRDLDLPDTTGLPGIFGVKTGKRVYPGGQVGANVVGFVGAEGKGLGGLEFSLDDILAGHDGRATYELSAGGRRIPSGEGAQRDAVPGSDVRLTIDRDIQWVAQQAIAKAVKATSSESGTVLVLDPHTGDLLAMSTVPTFDANKPGAAKPSDRGNRALAEPYEPGSTGKVITASALLEEGVVTPSTMFSVPNRLCRAGKCFKDWENHRTQSLTYAGTIARSSNIGTIKAAERLGNLKKLYPYLDRFGVGHPTGLGLPGESSGFLLKPSEWSATSGYTMAFGQGYSVNAVQMASVIATIANDGVRVTPRLVAGTTGADGKVDAAPASTGTRVIKAKTARTVRLLMEAVTGEGGTAPLARVPGYRVGGKTGTAQRFKPACGCYRGFTMSFLGLAPVDKPALVVAVTLQDPRSAIGGGTNAGPVFRDVMSFALETRRVPPTGTKPPFLEIEQR